jgi:L-threonylcarbamoyladenylate synthase
MAHVLLLGDAAVREAAERLGNGEIIIYGCDSNYILCTNMSWAASVKRIFDLKGRAYQQALPIIIDRRDADPYTCMTVWQREVVCQLLPGPISFIVPARQIPPYVNSGRETVSLVWHESQAMQQLYHAFGVHAGTSANLHGQPPPIRVEEAVACFGEAISLYLDSGPTRYGIPNTIIDLTQTPMALLREGPVSLQEVTQLIAQRVKLPGP